MGAERGATVPNTINKCQLSCTKRDINNGLGPADCLSQAADTMMSLKYINLRRVFQYWPTLIFTQLTTTSKRVHIHINILIN